MPVAFGAQNSAQNVQSEPVSIVAREELPGFAGLSVGNPSPSLLGFLIGWQLHSSFQIIGGGGRFWNKDIAVNTLGGGARFHVLPYQFSPFAGAGICFYSIEGRGKFQGLKTTTLALPFLNLGLDFISRSGLRLSSGVNFHFPVKLTLPFVDVGYAF
jgi:hypothetical protein